MITYALDFESTFDNECSITTLGPRGYFSHPDFDAYMVTVVGDDGYVYAGNPRDFDWSLLNGNVVLSHNASFDESLYLYGVEQGWFAPCSPAEWHCTADMVAFLGLPRALKNASATVFDLTVDKTVRDNMKNKRWETMTEEFRKEVTDYAIKDSELCLRLWQALSDKWPLHERAISALNRKIGQRGLPMDTALLQKNLERIKTELFEAEQAIPWTKDHTPLSRKAFNAQCRAQGITPPSSIAQDNEEADKWFAAHQQACPWARAVQNYRRINAFLKKLEAFDKGTMGDGRYYGGLMYCGANPTARFSGSGGNLNLQNLPRDEKFGVNFRHMIRPAEGKKLVVVDLAQIEVRTLFWWAKDENALKMIRENDDIYEVVAIMLGMHDPSNGPLKDNKPLRQRVKAMALGCQFGLSPDGFSAYSGLPSEEATLAVNTYQSRMRSVVRFWESLKEDIQMSCSLGEELKIDLPSGRSMSYGKLRRMRGITASGRARFSYVGKMVRMGQLRDFRIWHGLLAENCIFEESEVLTEDQGWVPMRSVGPTQRVWDGEEFVATAGFRSSGVQKVLSVHGVFATADHQFLVGGQWVPAIQACNTQFGEVSLPHYEERGLHGESVRLLHGDSPSWDSAEAGSEILSRGEGNLGSSVPMREGLPACGGGTETHRNVRQAVSDTQGEDVENQNHPRADPPQALCSVAFNERPMQTPEPSRMEELRGSGDHGVREMAEGLPQFLGGHGVGVVCGADSGSDRQRAGIQPRELSVGYAQPAGTEHEEEPDLSRDVRDSQTERRQTVHAALSNKPRVEYGGGLYYPTNGEAPVGDLLNCGPRSRFVVRAGPNHPPLIAHNCAQGLARDIFSHMMLKVEAAGYPIVLHVHDELVCEVAEDEAEHALAKIIEIMSTPPEWIPDIPLSAEGEVLDFYSK